MLVSCLIQEEDSTGNRPCFWTGSLKAHPAQWSSRDSDSQKQTNLLKSKAQYLLMDLFQQHLNSVNKNVQAMLLMKYSELTVKKSNLTKTISPQ